MEVNDINQSTSDLGDSFEPYVQLVRSLLPRASSVALFTATGSMRWSSETTTGPDVHALVQEALAAVGSSPHGPGQLQLLDGGQPVYLCWLRDDAERLIGVLTVVCRQNADAELDNRGFSFAYALLRPALECLRRDLVARAAIDALSRTVQTRDKDLRAVAGRWRCRSSRRRWRR